MDGQVSTLIHQEKSWCAQNYAPLPIVLTEGHGVWLTDDRNRRYLDMMSAYSAVSLGHSHPVLIEALTRQASRLAIVSRAFHSDQLAAFAEKVCRTVDMDRMLPMNSGAEAVETALKAARKWGYDIKQIAPGRARVIVCDGNFAGRTTTIVGFSSEPFYREGFGPFADGFDRVPFGDSDALEAAITSETAAFFLEPIQGEAGIIVPPDGYLKRCRELCDRHHVLMICDEVQTGLGRTGLMLACQHEGIKPDGITLGKALGGGLLPASAFVAGKEVMDRFQPGNHGSTFGGNPLACAVGSVALDLLSDPALLNNVQARSRQLLDGLRHLQHPALRIIRGRGLLVGIDMDPDFADAGEFCLRLAERGVLTRDTHHTVVRLAPPLIIDAEQTDLALSVFSDTLASYGNA